MPVLKGQRLKLLKIWEILSQETDNLHTMGTSTILDRLSEYGIVCDRRTLYSDIKALRAGGYKIECVRRGSNEYYVAQSKFSMAEIQILMDAVQAASFITEKKTKQLIDKIAGLAGERRAEVIKHNVVAFNTTKSNNENIFNMVSIIGNCIEKNRKVKFLYFDYDICGKRNYRRDSKEYIVNPIATIFSNEKYYLLCYDDKHGNLAHYRIDRMDNVMDLKEEITVSTVSDIAAIQKHKRQLFGMYNGEETKVTFEADNSLTDAVFDKFGFKTKLYAVRDKKFRFSATVDLSPVFWGWCCSFGNLLKITAPKKVQELMYSWLSSLLLLYSN